MQIGSLMANMTNRHPPALNDVNVKSQYPEFRRLLIQRMNEILSRREEMKAHLDEQLVTGPGDDADASVIDSSADYFLKLANGLQREIMEIRDAFDRMRRGVYGTCSNCEEPIFTDRLKSLPYAKLCMECQSTAERRIAQGAPRHRLSL